jgi:hypothetical protein
LVWVQAATPKIEITSVKKRQVPRIIPIMGSFPLVKSKPISPIRDNSNANHYWSQRSILRDSLKENQDL